MADKHKRRSDTMTDTNQTSAQNLQTDVMDLQHAFQVLLNTGSLRKIKSIMGKERVEYLLSDEFSMKAGRQDK